MILKIGIIVFILVIILSLLVLFFLIKNKNKKHAYPNDDIKSYPDQNTRKKPSREKKAAPIVKPYSSDDIAFDDAIKDIKERYDSAERIQLINIYNKDKNAVALFRVNDSRSKIIKKRVKKSIISRKELKERFDVEVSLDPLDLNLLSVESSDFDVLLDEFENIYLRIGKKSKHIVSDTIRKEELLDRAVKWINNNEKDGKENLELTLKDTKIHDATLNARFSDKENKEYLIQLDDKKGVKTYEKTISTEKENENSLEGYTQLPFSHGIEVELQVVGEDWRWLEGKQMAAIFINILGKSLERISSSRVDAPDLVKDRWNGRVKIKKDSRGHEAVHISYLKDGKRDLYSIIGKDSHVAVKTNILEIQTPPCQYLEELEWWSHILFKTVVEVVEEMEVDIKILVGGSNPMEYYSKGVSFGEHHHIKIEDPCLKNKIYNLYRILIPHLICLTVNSPYSDGKKPEFSKNFLNNLVVTDPSYSARLKNNREQFKVPPYLPSQNEKEYFEKKLGRKRESIRMVDIYPFSRFGTVEIRIFDSQFTTLDRMSIALLLQALALYAEEKISENSMLKTKTEDIYKNRSEAIENGPMGRYHHPEGIFDKLIGADHDYIHESCKHLLGELLPYMIKIAGEHDKAIYNLLLRVYGHEKLNLDPPLSPAQLLLLRIDEDSEIEGISETLYEITRNVLQDPKYNLWSDYIDLEKLDFSHV